MCVCVWNTRRWLLFPQCALNHVAVFSLGCVAPDCRVTGYLCEAIFEGNLFLFIRLSSDLAGA